MNAATAEAWAAAARNARSQLQVPEFSIELWREPKPVYYCSSVGTLSLIMIPMTG